MGDACCGGSAPTSVCAPEQSERRWRLVATAVAATAWMVGVVSEFTNAEIAGQTAFGMAIVAGGATFVPDALAGLRRLPQQLG